MTYVIVGATVALLAEIAYLYVVKRQAHTVLRRLAESLSAEELIVWLARSRHRGARYRAHLYSAVLEQSAPGRRRPRLPARRQVLAMSLGAPVTLDGQGLFLGFERALDQAACEGWTEVLDTLHVRSSLITLVPPFLVEGHHEASRRHATEMPPSRDSVDDA
jgi:hypothetical protein